MGRLTPLQSHCVKRCRIIDIHLWTTSSIPTWLAQSKRRLTRILSVYYLSLTWCAFREVGLFPKEKPSKALWMPKCCAWMYVAQLRVISGPVCDHRALEFWTIGFSLEKKVGHFQNWTTTQTFPRLFPSRSQNSGKENWQNMFPLGRFSCYLYQVFGVLLKKRKHRLILSCQTDHCRLETAHTVSGFNNVMCSVIARILLGKCLSIFMSHLQAGES